MSTIGRIFSILNIILAAAFLGFASANLASQQSWKKKHDDLQSASTAEKARLEGDLSATRADLQAKVNGLTSTETQLADEKTAHAQTQSDLDDERKRSSTNEGRIQELATNLDTYNQKLTDVNASAAAANQKAQEALDARYAAEEARDDALAAQNDAETALTAAQKSIADLEIALTGEQKSLMAVQTQLDSLVAATGVSLSEIADQPDVRGAVMAVSTALEPGLISIDKGTTDGIKRGMTFDIFNGTTYKGRVQVEAVRDSMCTCVIKRSVPGTSMAQGDAAATRI